MPRRITPRTTLEHLRKEAKRWLKALRSGAADARDRLDRAVSDAPEAPTLRDVQHALAREHGVSGWTALKTLVSDPARSGRPDAELVDRFLENACPDHHVRGGPAHVRARHTALRLLERFPGIAEAEFATQVVCGDLSDVSDALSRRRDLAVSNRSAANAVRAGVGGSGRWLEGDLDRNLGPKDWQPLLFACFTRLPLPAVTENAVAMARLLLDHGADPNAWFMAGDSRYTPLVGAIGEGEEDRPPHPRRDELVRLLLDRGAEPYDKQVIYNIHFHGDVLWFLELIHARSVQLGRGADWDNPDWPMLDMGGYGNGARWHLWIAIEHDDVRLAEWCLTHGASPDPAPPRSTRLPQRSLYEEAVHRGCDEIAELLVRHGARRTAVTRDGIEAFTAACLRLDHDVARAAIAAHPEYLDDPVALHAAASRNRADVATFLLDLGVSPDVANATNERPLHAAAYRNALDVARLLIDRGAAIDPVESNWHNTPLAAAVYAQHLPMITLLGRYSRDMWELVYSGQIERVRELVAEDPSLARTAGGGHTLLMWLPPQDEDLALELARILLGNGADPAAKNTDGLTAADRAERQGMFRVAELLRNAASPGPAVLSLARIEEMASNLLDAYRTGTPEAMRRHWNDTWHMRAWPAMRRYVLLDLGRVPAPDDEYIDITLDDARLLVAREHRFDDWAALRDYVASLPADRPMAVARPVHLYTAGTSADDRDGGEAVRDWEVAAERIAAAGYDAVAANGQMTDEALELISRNPRITTLRLGACRRLTDEGIHHLGRMPQLTRLDLSGTQLTDRGMAVLRDLPALTVLNVGGTRISDSGAAELAHCRSLRRVDMIWTGTGDGAIRALAGIERLTHFVSGSSVTDTGLAALHDIPAYKVWRGGEVSAGLTSPEAEPNMLTLRGTYTDHGMASLVGLDGVFGIAIESAGVSARGLEPLTRLPNLGKVSFDAHDDAMPYFAAMPRLRFLGVQDTDATDDGWVALARSRTIEGIWGRRCHGLRGRGFRALATMAALRNLAVSCLNVDDASLASLPTFPSLRELMPMDVPDAGYRHIGRCENLDTLTLMYCRDTGDEATGHIAGLARLRKYFASYTRITDRTPQLLAGMDSLEEVELDSCPGLSDAGIVALARLPRLVRLSLGGMPGVTGQIAGAFRPGVLVRHDG